MARRAIIVFLIVLGLACCAYLAVSLLLWRWQGALVFPAPTATLRAPEGEAAREGYRLEALETADGLTLRFWAAPPEPGRPVVLFLHGNGASAPSVAPVLAPLRRAGYGVLLAEYRGYSGNPGTPSERGLALDARAYADWAGAHGAGPPVVVGESLGTGVAVRLASERPVRGLALDSPFTSLAAAVRASPFWWAPTILLSSRFDSLSRIRRVMAPVLIVHGEADTVVPVRLSRVLVPAVPCLREALFLPGVVHTALRSDGSGRAVAALLRFLSALPADGRCASAAPPPG